MGAPIPGNYDEDKVQGITWFKNRERTKCTYPALLCGTFCHNHTKCKVFFCGRKWEYGQLCHSTNHSVGLRNPEWEILLPLAIRGYRFEFFSIFPNN